MGNALLDQNQKQDPKQIYQQWLQQNPDMVGRKVLYHNKLFETNYFKYCEFSIKMSVFFRRDNTPIYDYLKAFQVIQSLVDRYKCMHILPMRIVENKQSKEKQNQKFSQNFAIGMRQYVHQTLEQRLEARPSLTEQQKIWSIYQIVFAVYTAHDIFNAYHGNIRTSNFLLTTYHYLILTDFASYKPTYILQGTEQGLSQFRLFYSSSVQKCNFPPQKLVERDTLSTQYLSSKKLFNLYNNEGEQKEKSSDSGTTANSKKIKKNVISDDIQSQKLMRSMKRMDMFSMGLTILQVLNNGKPAMSYSDLVKMKKQGIDFSPIIQESVNKLSQQYRPLGDLLKELLKQKPQERIDATTALQKITGMIQYQFYLLLWTCLSSFNKSSFTSCDLRINLLYSLIDFIENNVRETGYKWLNKPPRCLSGFKPLKIFVELIDKKSIFSPKIEGNSVFFSKLLKFFEGSEEAKEVQPNQQQTAIQQVDERIKFFINPTKKSKIAKRMSMAADFQRKYKEVCPPSIKDLQRLIQNKHIPIKLTHIGMRSPRQQELIRQFKSNQANRQQLLKQTKYYKNAQILTRIIFSCIRGCKYVASKLVGIELINLLSKDCKDQFKLHVILPYMMHLSEDSDISVSRQAFLSLVNLFYLFIDPFRCAEDIHYYQIIIEYLIGIVKQTKLRSILFGCFKQVFYILQWLQIHYKRFNLSLKVNLNRLVQTLKMQYGYYSKQEVRLLLDGNIPDHFLPEMFQFYISLINTDRLEGLRLSVNLAKNVSPLTHRHILQAFDSCIEGGLQQYGVGLFYSIQYFTVRKNTSHFIIRKIAAHVLNPNNWVREEAKNYIRMCLNQYPPTKIYFFFRQIFQSPFPLKPEDMEDQILLPEPLDQSHIDWKNKVVVKVGPSPTVSLFNEYLSFMKMGNKMEKKRVEDQSQRWNEAMRNVHEAAQQGKLILNFQAYTKKQLDLLYEYNLLFYLLNMNNRYPLSDKEKMLDKTMQLNIAFKKMGRNIDINSIDHEKKELFEQFQGLINSSFERLLAKRNRDYGEPVSDKIKLAEAIITIGQVLCKFQMFKIKPIPKLGTYIRQPTIFEKVSRPKGMLVSQVFQHNDAITALEKVADQYILSGSADGTLRVFDSKKIQANITTCSQACIQFRGEGEEKVKIASIAAFDQTYSVIVGSNRGQIRVYPIQRLGKSLSSGRSDQIVKYAVGGQIQKIVTLANQLKNQCFCYVTSEGNLGVQDIRLKSRAMSCNIGRERGIPRSLCATNRQCILAGTVDGYVLNFDIRFNLISNVLQLQNESQTLPITNIVPVPLMGQNEEIFAFTYPGKYYEFSCFNLQDNRHEFGPLKQYTTTDPSDIISTPLMVNRTSDQVFKLCRNGLIWRKAYESLSDSNKNFNIFDYISDPLTRKEGKIRQIWLDNSKNRYNQISSLYNRKQLAYIEWIHSGILTTCNPIPGSPPNIRVTSPLALLTEKKDLMYKDTIDIERPLTMRPNNSHKIYAFNGEESSDYVTCCKILPNLVVLGTRNSQLKIYM